MSLGQEISRHRPELATTLGTGHSVFCVPLGDAQDHLHDERFVNA
jgi:hypothetical protein